MFVLSDFKHVGDACIQLVEHVNFLIFLILAVKVHKIFLFADLNLLGSSPLPFVFLQFNILIIWVVIKEWMEMEPSIKSLILIFSPDKIYELLFRDILQINMFLFFLENSWLNIAIKWMIVFKLTKLVKMPQIILLVSHRLILLNIIITILLIHLLFWLLFDLILVTLITVGGFHFFINHLLVVILFVEFYLCVSVYMGDVHSTCDISSPGVAGGVEIWSLIRVGRWIERRCSRSSRLSLVWFICHRVCRTKSIGQSYIHLLILFIRWFLFLSDIFTFLWRSRRLTRHTFHTGSGQWHLTFLILSCTLMQLLNLIPFMAIKFILNRFDHLLEWELALSLSVHVFYDQTVAGVCKNVHEKLFEVSVILVALIRAFKTLVTLAGVKWLETEFWYEVGYNLWRPNLG